MEHTREAFADALSSGDTESVNRAIDEMCIPAFGFDVIFERRIDVFHGQDLVSCERTWLDSAGAFSIRRI
jgi:hypothetical protein